jgi:hypothetical protein
LKAFQATTFLRTWVLAMAVALMAALPAAAQNPAPPAPKATPAPEGPPPVRATVPIRFYANVHLRQDFTDLEDRADLLLDGNNVDGLLTRLRFGMEFKDEKSTVSGGIRVSAGEAPNPASPFVRLGNAFRPVTFGLDQFYVDVRPFGNKERLHAVFGKMPQPFWRGDKGVIRNEMTFDDDISPVGAALQLQLYKSEDGGLRLENTAGYFIVEWFRRDRFAGLVGDTSLWADQLTLKVYRLTLAGAYYHWQNLNSGARAPSFNPGDSAFLLPGQSAFLLRSGFQATNAHYDLGSGVAVFRENEFDIVEGSAQLTVPIRLPFLGKTELVALGHYAQNGSVTSERDGLGVSLGIVGGDVKKRLKPYSLHGTWRRVKADAALGTFADSDLGAGTDVEGFEITGDIKVHKSLSLTASFFKFEGAPHRSTNIKRRFLGMVWDF